MILCALRLATMPSSLLGLLVGSALLFACGGPATKQEDQKPVEAPRPSAATIDPACENDSTSWGYTADLGPAHWSDLSSCFKTCASGEQQSPIDISQPLPRKLSQIRFVYQPFPLRVINDGRTIQVSSDGQSAIDFEETTFRLQQIHFHSPSEHTIKGRHAPMEMHLVHQSNSGNLAVVGVFLEIGEESDALASIWEKLPPQQGPETSYDDVAVRTAALLPSTTTSYRYQGSLTTPPCREGVQWIVLSQHQTISQEQLDTFNAIFSGNNRPAQPIGDRAVGTDRLGSGH